MKYFRLILITLFASIGLQASARCNADFSYTQNGSTFTFYDSSYTVNGSKSHWSFGDGTSAVGDIVTHSYNTQDTFEVCLVVEDTVANCLDTICKFVSNITSGGGNTSGCNLGMLFSPTPADPYKYTFVNISNGADSYLWLFPNGDTSTAARPIYDFDTLGVFEVCLVGLDTGGNACDTICRNVTITNSSGNSCSARFTFVSQGLVNSFTSYSQGRQVRWELGDGDTSDRTSPIHIYDTLGTYTVCLYVYDSTANGAVVLCDSSCQTITIGGAGGNSCNASFTYSSRGLLNTFFSNAAGKTLVWDFGDGDTSMRPTPIHIYDSLGTYTVCLYVYDSTASGLSVCDSSCQIITIGSSGGNNCAASFSYNLDSLNFKKVYFNNSSIGSRYLWKFGDGKTDTTKSPSHVYDSAGTYQACLYIVTQYDSLGLPVICDSICRSVVVSPSPVQCKASFYLAIDTTSKYHLYIMSNSTGTNSTTSYLWTFGDGDSSTLKNPSHQYASFGLYELCLTISTRTATGVCTSAHCDSIGMDSSGMLLKNGAFGISVIDESDLLSTSEIEELTDFKIYPNPTKGKVNVSLNAMKTADMDIQVINIMGQEVLNYTTQVFTGSNTIELDLQNSVNGLHFIKMSTREEPKVVRVVLKK